MNSLCPSGGGRGRGESGGGGGGPLEVVGPENHIKSTTCSTKYSIQNIEYRCSKTQVHKITNLTDFYMGLGLNDCDAGKSITRAIGRSGPRKSPTIKSLCLKKTTSTLIVI